MLGVMNHGIGGAPLLHDIRGESGLRRFDRDVLAQTGVTHVIALMGINDMRGPAAAAPSTAVIDFEKALRDPGHPTRMLPAYDCGDHLHPSDAGYLRMGDAIDLSLFD